MSEKAEFEILTFEEMMELPDTSPEYKYREGYVSGYRAALRATENELPYSMAVGMWQFVLKGRLWGWWNEKGDLRFKIPPSFDDAAPTDVQQEQVEVEL